MHESYYVQYSPHIFPGSNPSTHLLHAFHRRKLTGCTRCDGFEGDGSAIEVAYDAINAIHGSSNPPNLDDQDVDGDPSDEDDEWISDIGDEDDVEYAGKLQYGELGEKSHELQQSSTKYR